MNCVILQPSYIPWRGYFHQIQKADVFVFFDDVQYDNRGWRHRNRIKTANGSQWLSIPVYHRGSRKLRTAISDIRVCWDRPWNNNHWTSIRHSYSKTPYFQQYEEMLSGFYSSEPEYLAEFTIDLTIALTRELGIVKTQFLRSSKLTSCGTKTDRLINILQEVGATHYISGPSAQNYVEEDKFQTAGITLEYMTYDYPEYPQLYPPFDTEVSVLDLLFMTGPEAPKYIWECNTPEVAAPSSTSGAHLP